MKICTHCLVLKNFNEFYKRNDGKENKYTSHCKMCLSEKHKTYKNSTHGRETIKRYFQSERVKELLKNYELTEKRILSRRRASKKHALTIKGKKTNSKCVKRYMSTEKGKRAVLKATKKYYRTEKGKKSGIAVSSKRRALKKGLKADLTKDQIKKLIVGTKFCPHCGVKLGGDVKVHLDHIIPISKGGSHTIYNVQILCAPCNMKKSANPDYLYGDGQTQIGLT